ncbi:hypothetical protein A2U01_0066409, partial [Trifolium medium]|nr:hypothetical protein [Trifolium medium]
MVGGSFRVLDETPSTPQAAYIEVQQNFQSPPSSHSKEMVGGIDGVRTRLESAIKIVRRRHNMHTPPAQPAHGKRQRKGTEIFYGSSKHIQAMIDNAE